MNYTYICAIILLSLKDVCYDIFWYIVLFLITYITLLYLYCWYYDIDIIEEIIELDTENKNILKYDSFDNIFSKYKSEEKYVMPEDSDDEENISVSFSDIKFSKEKEIKKEEDSNKNFNTVPLKDIINKDKIENINDLLEIAKYYEENILKSNDTLEILNNNKIYKYGEKYYTINLEVVHNIKGSLIKLKKMVGLTVIKNEIIDLILYYLMNFIPNNNMLHMTLEGPPGCGKTKLAKIISQILNKMDILSSDKIVYAKSTDLIAEYVGQTGQKTQKVINSALGGVLFIDEAYGIGNSRGREHNFGAECINVLNQNLSDNKNKFICIIAGYPNELDEMFFSINPGLKRRFPFKFTIEGYTYQELMKIFIQKVYKLKWKIDSEIDLDKFFSENYKQFKYFGGDIDTLIQNIKYSNSRRIICNKEINYITAEDLNNALNKLKNSRKENTKKSKNKKDFYNMMKKIKNIL
jgi:SpoVK/Ycf46/Vps4 family AAA+-type ATPase